MTIPTKNNATINGQYIRNSSSTAYTSKTEAGTIPSAPYTLELEEKISPGSIITATINAAPAEIIPWSYAPQPGEIAVDRQRGFLKFNEDDVGLTFSVTYSPCGTVITVAKLDKMIPEKGLTTTVTVDGTTLTFTDGILTGVS